MVELLGALGAKLGEGDALDECQTSSLNNDE